MSDERPIGELLPDDVLARRQRLPVKPDPVILEGGRARLRPLDLARDVEPLFAVSNGQPASLGERSVAAYDADAEVWRYMPAGPFADPAGLDSYLGGLAATPNLLPLCVDDVATGRPVGVVTFMSNEPAHLKIELGNIWYSPLVQGSGANREATYLMLRHAFDLGYRRGEWKCDALNARSRHTAERMGFTFEGIQQAHFIVKGRNRDTAWFRILVHEWPDVQARLEGMLSGMRDEG
ncbi:MAG TPA: GNAT family protein [Thermomicrobiales bacterium]|nr:GNAT family protein [Thermomicrobiales bacterium]